MNVLVFASRKGGSGKSTLAAHLSVHAARPSRPTLLVDADPQGSLSLWHGLRGEALPALVRGTRHLPEIVKSARREGYEWASSTPRRPSRPASSRRSGSPPWSIIPARPGVFDLAAVRDTIELARELRKPYCVVMNGAPAKRSDADAAVVAEARQGLNDDSIPVWSGQITHRADYSLALGHGEGVRDFDPASAAAAEMAQLWSAVDRSVKAINGLTKGGRGMHGLAA